jgi:hypothetical protein
LGWEEDKGKGWEENGEVEEKRREEEKRILG